MAAAAVAVLPLLLAAAVSAAAPRLPNDISQWPNFPQPSEGTYKPMERPWPENKFTAIPDFQKPINHTHRFWDRATLQQARVVNNFEQVRPLLDKLNAGQPITVVAFGDSNTQNMGGCFMNDGYRQKLRAMGVVVKNKPEHFECIEYRQTPIPWLATFMSQVNASWPHRDHVLINLGSTGATFKTFAEGDCWERFLPRKVDLVVMQHLIHTYGDGQNGVAPIVMVTERLLHRLWLHLQAPLPAVIMLTMTPLLYSSNNREAYNNPNVTSCVRDPRRCPIECPTILNDKPSEEQLRSVVELATHDVAKHHGLASLSHTAFLNAMRRDVPQRRHGLSECEAFSLLYHDGVHPDIFGRLSLSDMLIDYLASAEAYLSDPAAAARAVVAAPAAEGGSARFPLHPLNPQSEIIYKASCMYAAPLNLGGANGNSIAANVNARPMRMGGRPGRQAMQVAKADGWVFVEYDGDQRKRRPGLVSTAPGSVLWLVVWTGASTGTAGAASAAREGVASAGTSTDQTSTAALPGGASGAFNLASSQAYQASLHIRLTYLKSYRHMGRAQVTCLESCFCGNDTIEGHHEPQNSLPFIHDANVIITQPVGRCVLQVVVRPETSSGEHKVKLMHVAVGVMVNVTKQLQALAMASQQQA